MEPILITRDGLSAVPFGSSIARRNLVMWEDRLHVEAPVRASNRRFVVLGHRRSPRGARVCHQHVEMIFSFR